MEIELLDCKVEHLKWGKFKENVNIDQYVFTDYRYWIANEDKVIGHLFKDFEKAFVSFKIINN